MGYWLSIGKAEVSYSRPGKTEAFPPFLRPEIHQADYDVEEPGEVHSDKHERAPGAYRNISYHSWSDTLNRLSRFHELMAKLAEYVNTEQPYFIPIEFYEDDLYPVLEEAEGHLTREHDTREDRAAAQRALWFCRWSFKSRDLYDEYAAFKSPGEWK